MEEQKDIFDFLEKKKLEIPSDAYFASLANSIIDEIPTESKEPKIVPMYRKPLVWISTAAAAVLLIFLMQPEASKTMESGVDFNDLSRGEILAYVEYNLDEFDEELLAEFIPDSRLQYTMQVSAIKGRTETPIDAPSEELSEILDEVSSDDILDYLEDEGIDLEDLEDEIF